MSKEMELRCGLDSGYHTPSSSAQTPELPKKKKPSNSPLIKQALRRVSQQLQQPDMLCELTAIQNRREDSAPESGYDTPSSGMQTPELGIKKNPSPLMINQAITKSLKNRAFYHQSDPCEFANDEGTFEERSENQGNPLYSTSDPVTSEFKEELYADSHVQPAKSLAFPDIPVSDFLYLHEQHYEERRGGMAEEVVLSELFNLPLLLAHSEKAVVSSTGIVELESFLEYLYDHSEVRQHCDSLGKRAEELVLGDLIHHPHLLSIVGGYKWNSRHQQPSDDPLSPLNP